MQGHHRRMQAEPFDFETEDTAVLELEDDYWKMEIVSERRRAPRVYAPVLHVLESVMFRQLDVIDVSKSGIRVQRNGWRFIPGDPILFDIIYQDRFVIKNTRARVVRVDMQSIGCRFINISPVVGVKLVQFVSAII